MYALFVVLDVILLFAGWIVPFVLLSRADRRHSRVDNPHRDRHIAAHCLVTIALTTTFTVGAMVTAPGRHDVHPLMVAAVIVLQLGWLLPPTVLGVLDRQRYRPSRQEYAGS